MFAFPVCAVVTAGQISNTERPQAMTGIPRSPRVLMGAGGPSPWGPCRTGQGDGIVSLALLGGAYFSGPVTSFQPRKGTMLHATFWPPFSLARSPTRQTIESGWGESGVGAGRD